MGERRGTPFSQQLRAKDATPRWPGQRSQGCVLVSMVPSCFALPPAHTGETGAEGAEKKKWVRGVGG